MKALTIALAALCSIQAHAFTTVTLKKDLTLKASATGQLVLKAESVNSSGNDYCHLVAISQKNEESTVLKKGITFTVSEETNRCGQDWGKQCRLDISAYNQESEARLGLICKDRGFFAQELSASKVNKLLKEYVEIK